MRRVFFEAVILIAASIYALNVLFTIRNDRTMDPVRMQIKEESMIF